jgi:hypothetical protein
MSPLLLAPAGAPCPIVLPYVKLLENILPEGDDVVQARRLAVDASAAPLGISAARAVCFVEHVVKNCLPEGFAMFGLQEGADKVRALPLLETPEVLQVYATTLQSLNEQTWTSPFAGESLMRDSLLRPLVAAERAVRLLAMGEISVIGELLTPVMERLGKNEDFVALLDILLAISEESANDAAMAPAAEEGMLQAA